jgi:short-subunit dehydrogenase
MTQKKVIIIGATSGIGRQLAILYAQNNWLVGITGRRTVLLDELSAAYPGKMIAATMDVTAPEATVILEQLIQQMNGMDLLIYNSGFGDTSKQLNWNIEQQTTLTNVNGFVAITNFAYNWFLDKPEGHIAATSSIASIRGNSFAPAYSASKAYMSTYLEGLLIKIKKQKRNIYLTDIQPGFVDTKMAMENGRFWVATPEKAAGQIFTALGKKRFRVYITRRWWLVAKLMKWLPDFIYHRIG